mmetsp:Transcript_17984/g.41233  ORF Transcript_17984/g.41233 Transcript_17984/m.41233 type:complete len:287 (+) Transcript_17984:626-1486(+)
MYVVHALALSVRVPTRLLVLDLLMRKDHAQDEKPDEHADEHARAHEDVERARLDRRVALKDVAERESDAAVAAVIGARRDVAPPLAEAVAEDGSAIHRAEREIVVRVLRGLDRAILRGRWRGAQFKTHARLHCVAPRVRLLTIGVAAVVVTAEAVLWVCHVRARVHVWRLVRPVLALVAREGDRARPSVVSPVLLLVALVRVVVAIGAIPAARLVVADLIALVVVDVRRQAAVSASRVSGDAIVQVPLARRVVARLVAVAVAEPRQGAARRAEVLQLVLAVVTAIS